jgi:hypothetical protein
LYQLPLHFWIYLATFRSSDHRRGVGRGAGPAGRPFPRSRTSVTIR